jgi:hypothetical protein
MVSSALAVEEDVGTGTDAVSVTVNEAILEMQQEMIRKNYSARLLRNQMRAQMMAERMPENFMQDSVQAVMVEKVRELLRASQMKDLMIR